MTFIPFLLKSSSVTLFPPGAEPLVVDQSHMNFKAVREAILAGDFDLAVSLGSVAAFVNTVTQGKVSVSEHGVTYNGGFISGYLAEKMVQFFNEGLPVDHYCLFLENIMTNPSMTSRRELFLFLEAADLPITQDGCFLAYKAVRFDFKDKHSGKFDNSPGAVLTMPRESVDDARERTCSYGFHVAAYEYAKNFLGGSGDKLVSVKVNPKDVVSVPSDYQNQKLRTCAYEVLAEIPDAFDIFKGQAYVNTAPLDAEVDRSDEYNSSDTTEEAYNPNGSDEYQLGYDDGYTDGHEQGYSVGWDDAKSD